LQIGSPDIGKMGAAIAQRLIDGRATSRGVNDPRTSAAVPTRAPWFARHPAEMAKNAEAVITILDRCPASDAVDHGAGFCSPSSARQAVHRDEHGCRRTLKVGACATKCARKARTWFECPVGGSNGPARQGKADSGLMARAGGSGARNGQEQLCAGSSIAGR